MHDPHGDRIFHQPPDTSPAKDHRANDQGEHKERDQGEFPVDPEHCAHDTEDSERLANRVDKAIGHRVVDDPGVGRDAVIDVGGRAFLKKCHRKLLGFL